MNLRKTRGKKYMVSYRIYRCEKCGDTETFPFDCICEEEEE